MEKLIVGQKYGMLTVLENHHPKDEAVCRCECGNIKVARASNIYYGGTKSCGCMINKGNTKHGDRHTRLYSIWKGMIVRCYTKSSTSYKRYGAKGITVCDEWRDYTVFKEWALRHGYSDNLTIDRIDSQGNYTPENCRWATYKEQANNKSKNHLITIDGVTHTMTEWAEISGISVSTIWARLDRGWNEKKAVFHNLIKARQVIT